MKWNDLCTVIARRDHGLGKDQPWCRAMADCQQDGGWHSEGNVWTHTQLVCAELPRSTTGRASRLDERMLLALHGPVPRCSQAAHVPGRSQHRSHHLPQTCRERQNTLPGRSCVTLGCDLTTREEIARLVRYHGRPAFLLERANPAHEVISLSWFVSNRLLYLFAIADTRGRRPAT